MIATPRNGEPIVQSSPAKVDDSLQPVVFCADDFGLAPGVSEAISDLIRQGRLSATSCMSGCAAWPSHAALLREAVTTHPADVGLHLTLTGQRPLLPLRRLAPRGGFLPLGRLLALSLAGAFPRDEFRGELRAQLDAFEEHWGAPPDYVDGHQHVHLLPGVREVLIEELVARYGPDRVYLRNCAEPYARCVARRVVLPKALFISWLGHGLAAQARRAGIAMNEGFAGLHDFSGRVPFRKLMQAFLAHRAPRHLIHVHPGRVDTDLVAVDPLTMPRERELAYLAGDGFAEDMLRAGVRPGRFRECRGAA